MIIKKTLTIFSYKIPLLPFLMGMLAFLGGIVNGFLGTGGGIVMMFALSLIPSSEENARDKFATVIAVILPLSLISAIMYGDAVSIKNSAPYILPGILGGVCGALLLDKINLNFLKRLFALMVIWAGINFLR